MSKFTPSPAEVALVNQIFAQADAQKLGVITGEAAVKIFNGAKLPPAVLADIWNLADDENNGVLTRKGVAVAVRLLGHAQRGEKVSEALVNRPGPVPTIEGLTPPLTQQTTGVPLARSPPPGLPPLTPQDKAKFIKLFISNGPINGLLHGDKARDVFVKSKLPVDKLSQIWSLADTKNRGALDVTDFTIAMYLIQASMSGHLQTIPSALPPSLYEQAASKGGPDSIVTHTTGSSTSYSPSLSGGFPGRPLSTIQPQYTGQSAIQPQMTGNRSLSGAPPLPTRSNLATAPPVFPFVQQHSTGQAQQWDVTPAEKASADKLFDSLDTQKRGYIEGDVAVPFMLQSKLSEDALAQIWDLADLNNDGRLTQDGFAVAMHLIQKKMAGNELPTSIPQSLIPPSMRTPTPATSVPQSSVQDSLRDLLWDDTPPPSSTFSPSQHIPLQPQSTGPLSSVQTPASFPPPAQASRVATSPDPFASSPFGSTPSAHHDLLGDDDEHVASSPPLHDKSAEIGNTKNQLESTNRSLETVKNDRANVERVLAEQAAQLSALQTQLSSAKAAYETETRLLTTLRERFAAQSADIQKAREDLIHAESDLSAVRVEKAEIEGSVLRDKEEIRELHRKMLEVDGQLKSIKVDVEKAKKDAKQQKGMLAIAKKQLATREAERAKAEKELEEARKELDDATKEREEAEAALQKLDNAPEANKIGSSDTLALAMAQPLPASPPELGTSASAASSPGSKSTNPFERLALASPSTSSSPFLPFVGSAVLTSSPGTSSNNTEGPTTAEEDPFGLSQLTTDETPVVPEPELQTPVMPGGLSSDNHSTVPPATVSSPIHDEHDAVSPTDTDLFTTPPSTAVPTSPGTNEVSEEAARFPALDAAAVDIAATNKQDGDKPSGSELDHQIKEIEEDDSDTESEDDQPLASVQTKLAGDSVAPSNGAAESTASAVSAFDDSFGVTTLPDTPLVQSVTSTPVRSLSPAITSAPAIAPAPAAAPGLTPAKDPFGLPPTETSAPAAQPPVVAPTSTVGTTSQLNGKTEESGVSEFDEAMGKLPSDGSSGLPSQFSEFSFDSAFDDNFDFAAASAANTGSAVNGAPAAISPPGLASAFPPAPAAHPPAPAAVPAFPSVPAPAQQNGAFDSVFMTQPSSNGVPAPAPSVQAVPQQAKPSFDDVFGASTSDSHTSVDHSGPSAVSHSISFDDAFGGADASDALALGHSTGGSQYQPPAGPPPSRSAAAPFPGSTPSSPTRASDSSRPSGRRSISPPPRQVSPPPRHSSPRPRTGSSDKVSTGRSSKLSIRLPFGRKKAKHDAPPLPRLLSEEPSGTPAVEDDVEAVKQLCGMGFSRTQAVVALEQYDYDVQRALNSLLGQ